MAAFRNLSPEIVVRIHDPQPAAYKVVCRKVHCSYSIRSPGKIGCKPCPGG